MDDYYLIKTDPYNKNLYNFVKTDKKPHKTSSAEKTLKVIYKGLAKGAWSEKKDAADKATEIYSGFIKKLNRERDNLKSNLTLANRFKLFYISYKAAKVRYIYQKIVDLIPKSI